MQAKFQAISKSTENLDHDLTRVHGIGEIDCEFKHFTDVIKHYSKRYGKPNLSVLHNGATWEDDDYLYYLTLVDIFTFATRCKVRSNNNFSPISFDLGFITERHIENYYPYYTVQYLQNGMVEQRVFREKDLIQAL
jgi:hypothetical protein